LKDMKGTKKPEHLMELAMECMGVAVTIIDTEGTLLYYNMQAGKILDRKPEYLGKDIHSHHRKAASNRKLDLMLQDFQKGRTERVYASYYVTKLGKMTFNEECPELLPAIA
jgi:DUF438 domain-containing protein